VTNVSYSRAFEFAYVLAVFALLGCAKDRRAVEIQGGTIITASGGITPMPTAKPNPTLPPVALNPDVGAPNPPAAVVATAPQAPLPPVVEPSRGRVGILRCDTFVDRYLTCINRQVPAESRAPLLRDLEASIQRWKEMAKTPSGATDVGNECLSAFDRTKQAMTPYACTWEGP